LKLLAWLAPLAILTAALSTKPALAQGVDEFGAYGGLEDRGHVRTPQEVAVEVRFGHYRPDIDDDLSGSPYRDIFGGDKRWQIGAELDWQVLRLPRTLSFGPGIGFGFTRSSAKAPLADGSQMSAQDTTLNILPFHLVGVLRVDALADRTPVPLAPYAKLGFGYALWWSSLGEHTSRVNGDPARDNSYGYVVALGLLARLDWLDPQDAAAADAAIGLNHSGLFIEWFKSDLGGFGSDDKMQVGTSTWVAGLTLEM
jgi:hypothetical protein